MDIDLELRDDPLDIEALAEYWNFLRAKKELKTVLLVSQLCVINGRLGILKEFTTRPGWRDDLKRITEVVS